MDLTKSIEPKSDQAELWRPVVGFEGAYEVSNLGRVRSLDRITDRGRNWRGRVLRATCMPRGYRSVTLWRDGAQRSALVHRLVLMAFSGHPRPGDEARHLDGNPGNNALNNLAWGSHTENQFDQVAHGTHSHAVKTHCAQGHEFTDENTYSYPGRVHRACRTCRRSWASNGSRKAVA